MTKRTQELAEELIRLLGTEKQMQILDGLVRDGLITSYTVQASKNRFLTMTREEIKITETLSDYAVKVAVTHRSPEKE